MMHSGPAKVHANSGQQEALAFGIAKPRIKICRMKKARILSFLLLLAAAAFSCQTGVEEKEFLARYKELSNRRIQFRLNMKALGDSTKRQRKFAITAIREAQADTAFEQKIEVSYALWSDSLRNRLADGLSYFETQYSKNRPLIKEWEKSEMRLDGMVQRIKTGELSEEQGLDSMNIMLKQLDALIIRTDTLLKISNRRYWDFRRDLDEYRFNARNLKMLYANRKKG